MSEHHVQVVLGRQDQRKPTSLYVWRWFSVWWSCHEGNKGYIKLTTKVANLELMGLMNLYGCNIKQLRFPLVNHLFYEFWSLKLAIIDYKGFRVLAVSVLPVGKETIKYGEYEKIEKLTECQDRVTVAVQCMQMSWFWMKKLLKLVDNWICVNMS